MLEIFDKNIDIFAFFFKFGAFLRKKCADEVKYILLLGLIGHMRAMMMKFVHKYLPFFLFCLFILAFFILAFPRHGMSILEVLIECASPWFAALRDLIAG